MTSVFESKLEVALKKVGLRYQTSNFGENRIDGLSHSDFESAPKDTYGGMVRTWITTGGLLGTGIFGTPIGTVRGVPECNRVTIELGEQKYLPQIEQIAETLSEELSIPISVINISAPIRKDSGYYLKRTNL
mgnify:CR=1 FL=1